MGKMLTGFFWAFPNLFSLGDEDTLFFLQPHYVRAALPDRSSAVTSDAEQHNCTALPPSEMQSSAWHWAWKSSQQSWFMLQNVSLCGFTGLIKVALK